MKLTIENPRAIIGNYDPYVINGVRVDPDRYEFRLGTLQRYPEGMVYEEDHADVTLFRNIVEDMDGNQVCSIVNPKGQTHYISVKWLSHKENAINTIIKEYIK